MESDIDPTIQAHFGMDIRVLGHARIIEVLPEKAVARFVDGDEKAVNRLDRFITE